LAVSLIDGVEILDTVLNYILLQIAYQKYVKHLCDGRLMLNKLLI